MEKDYFDRANEDFLDFLNDLFNIKKAKSWDDISKSITLEKVKHTYKVFAKIFPLNFDYVKELEKSKDVFSSLHFSDIKARKIINEVVRFSLYSEKIIIFHPLQNPSITNQSIDPRKNPKYWLPDFLDALYFYVVIQKWVKAGIIKLIVNPCAYDFELRAMLKVETEKRIANLNIEDYYKHEKTILQEHIAESFLDTYQNRSKEFIISELLKMNQPKFDFNDANEFAEVIINGRGNINPLYTKLNIPLDQGMLVTLKAGGSLEEILLISKLTNSNIYTPSKGRWHELIDYGINDFWAKTNKVYSEVPLNFLNSVDTDFALELRKEDRLSGVRQQFKKIFSELNGLAPESLTDSKVRDLHEAFQEEIKRAEAEWNDIKIQANIARRHWLVANVGVPIVKNDISLLPLALGSLAWLYQNEKIRKQKEGLQRQKNPISVYVDLKNQQQGFFSILKNCLF